MEYTQYGRTGLTVSRFGLGCMRFPKDERESADMVRYAIDHGVNYLDTAYAYPDSESIIGKALRDGYRNKTYLATKNPVWAVNRYADFEKYLDLELRRLGTDHIDVYLLHNLHSENWKKVVRYDGLAFLDRMIKKGKILHQAFSAHTTLPHFKQVVDAYDWDMAQLQLNILDEHQQMGVEGLHYAAQKGLATVIMEPLRGGTLLNQVPAEVQRLIDSFPVRRSLAEWCFRWLYDMPQVTLILSGTSSLDQLKDNLRIFEQSGVGVMDEGERELIEKIKGAYESIQSIRCTGCRYCMPCPSGVNIPEIFKIYNSHQISKPHTIDRFVYQKTIVRAGSAADRCVSCGQCTEHCPQGLNIPELLKTAHAELSV